MNKKQKILTIVALVAFGAVVALHYTSMKYVQLVTPWNINVFSSQHYLMPAYAIEDIRMPLFVLAVFYGGLFFILGEQKPRG